MMENMAKKNAIQNAQARLPDRWQAKGERLKFNVVPNLPKDNPSAKAKESSLSLNQSLVYADLVTAVFFPPKPTRVLPITSRKKRLTPCTVPREKQNCPIATVPTKINSTFPLSTRSVTYPIIKGEMKLGNEYMPQRRPSSISLTLN
eukprot:TRINITY_DN10994_c0_g1_i1.p3 TRINITY_DN10994_c0_g1~~TRINITY_DN10994_c0_g1_i1.p3  ORF type:complete len:147 (-),score=13.47 TRINITY_DN10994_c0_g1_i1:63-503(-)